MKDMNKISLISLGCAKAMVDSEHLLGSLNKYNAFITDRHDQADVIIINTCGFLDSARQESIDTIFEAASLKTKGNLKKLVVMGCLSERYPEELSKQIPEVDKFFGTTNQNQIIQYLFGKEYVSDDPNYYRSLLTPNHYAYLKIAEGCDNGCSFCSIPLMRGLQKSRSIDSILWEVEKLLENNVKEIMVIAQDSTSYGWDLRPKSSLANLIQELDKSGIDWFRLHYAHPAHLSLKIIDALANASNFCRYIDMPVQHGSDKILKSMRRGLDSKSINKRIDLLKKNIPGIKIRSTVIVGYPGEGDNEFKELYDFIDENKFDRLGVFTYSEEEGTIAEKLEDNIPIEIKNERKGQLLDLQAEISLSKNKEMIGNIIKVIVDRTGTNTSIGRTEFDSPEVDNIVHIKDSVEKGVFVNVKVDNVNEFELIGNIVN